MQQQPTEKLVDLLEAACDGTFDAGQFARLEELLLSDRAARQFYLRYMAMDAELSLQAVTIDDALARAIAMPVGRCRGRSGSYIGCGPPGSVGRKASQAAVLAGGLLMGVLMGQQTWRSVHPSNAQQARQVDPVAVYELDYLTDAPNGSLAGSFLTLTESPSGNGA